MSNYAIEIEGLWKQYRLGESQPYTTLRDILTNPLSALKKESQESFWALKDINLQVKEGEVLGVIGKNGSGKSTLLKILTQITPPTKGQIKLNGRVASLLEVGTGFSPELTGRENIFLNGSILGMTKQEIRRKFDEIVDFSGVEKFIDTPVKRYSSGMYVRLAFAVAAHLESEILLVDEVLAVGDAEFQKKCLGKMRLIAQSGRTVLFVSHNLGVVKNLCSKCVYLESGQIKSIGSTAKVVDEYIEDGSSQLTNFVYNKDLNKPVQINNISIVNSKNEESTNLTLGEEFTIKVEYIVREAISSGLVSVIFYTNSQEFLLLSDKFDYTKKIEQNLKPGRYLREIKVPAYLFNTGNFSFDIVAHIPLVKFFDEIRGLRFTVINDGGLKAKVYKKETHGITAFPLEHIDYKIN